MPATVNWSVRPNQAVFLTYSQATCTIDDVQAFLDSIGCDHHIVGHELHADGGHHYHCIAHFSDVQRWRNARVFDIGELHPNVEFAKAKGSVGRILAYCKKEGDWYATDDAIEFFDALAEESTAKVSRNELWTEIIESSTESEFWANARRLAPYEYGTRYSQLQSFAEAHYKVKPYVAPDVTWPPSEKLDELNAWVDEHLVCVCSP